MVDVQLNGQSAAGLPAKARVCCWSATWIKLNPSGPGIVLRQLLRAGVVPVVRLTEVFRQAAQQPHSSTTAHQINEVPECRRAAMKADESILF